MLLSHLVVTLLEISNCGAKWAPNLSHHAVSVVRAPSPPIHYKKSLYPVMWGTQLRKQSIQKAALSALCLAVPKHCEKDHDKWVGQATCQSSDGWR